jgi:hypothetical protein
MEPPGDPVPVFPGVGVGFLVDENGIAELVCAIGVLIQFLVHAAERCVVNECPQQIIVTGARFVRARENGVDHP